MNSSISTERADKPGGGIRISLRFKFIVAISILVTSIILSFSIYFILRETKILEDQIFYFIKSEISHLAGTAGETIGLDELALLAAVNNLKKIEYVEYAYILGADNRIIQCFDKNREFKPGEVFTDGVSRVFTSGGDDGVLITPLKGISGKRGQVFDFSKGVFNIAGGRQIGTAIIGFSDWIIREEVSRTTKAIALISFFMLCVSVVAGIVLAGITLGPVRKLSQGAAIIGSGNLEHRIEIRSRDELGLLAQEFNQMTTMIREAREKEIESRVMQEQLEVAKEIQEGLNPMAFYRKGGIEIKGFTKAARGVGGDYFDYIDIDEHRVGALISDVSGKGVPASLVMVMIKTVFTTYISSGAVDCGKVVTAINDALSAGMAIDKFATLFFTIYDRRTEELSFANAGHGPLFCYRAARKACTLTKLDGVPIGIMEDVVYRQAKVKLYPGDFIVMYTDGVTEMRNAAKKEYGSDRLHRMMIEHSGLNAAEFVDLIVGDVDRFRGDVPPHDDETILVLKRV